MDEHEVDMSAPITDSPSRFSQRERGYDENENNLAMAEVAEADSEFERTNQFAQYDF